MLALFYLKHSIGAVYPQETNHAQSIVMSKTFDLDIDVLTFSFLI